MEKENYKQFALYLHESEMVKGFIRCIKRDFTLNTR